MSILTENNTRVKIAAIHRLHTEDFVTAGVIVACLVMYSFFPTANIFQQIVSSMTFLLVIPWLYVKIILKKNSSEYGIQRGNWLRGALWSAIAVLLGVLVVYLLVHYANFLEKYTLPITIREQYLYFLGYEVALTGFFVLLYEIFFRGFVLFSFSPRLRFWAVIIQAAAFILLLLFSGGFTWSFSLYIIFSFLAGLIAYYSGSIFYSTVASFMFIVIADAMVIFFSK